MPKIQNQSRLAQSQWQQKVRSFLARDPRSQVMCERKRCTHLRCPHAIGEALSLNGCEKESDDSGKGTYTAVHRQESYKQEYWKNERLGAQIWGPGPKNVTIHMKILLTKTKTI